MADAVDHAQQYEQEERERHIRNVRQRAHLPSSIRCEACDAPIPAARRAAVPGVSLCTACQQIVELKQRHYRRGA